MSGRAARRERGYTVVELVMSLSVLAVGVAGVIAMQSVTIASNRHARDLAVATHIAQAWMDMLGTESSLWTEKNDLTRTTWLAQVDSEASWFRPAYSGALNFGPAFDPLGNAVSGPSLPDDTQYCVDLRLLRLEDASAGAGLIRAEVRVYWRRENVVLPPATTAPAHACALEPVVVSSDTTGTMFHFVYMSSAVRQQLRGDSPS